MTHAPPAPPPPADEICGDAFDMLMTIGDFAEFKELMLEHKAN